MSAIMEELRYRWRHGQPSLPGELRPAMMEMTDGLDPLIAQVVFAIGPPDRMAAMWKRRLRAFLGYGSGWTLREAIGDKLASVLWRVGPVSILLVLLWGLFVLGRSVGA